jgi:hypothetical protein
MKRLTILAAAVVLMAFVLQLAPAQNPNAVRTNQPRTAPAAGQFDPRDLSGVWYNHTYREGGRGKVRLFGPDGSNPALTPAGEARRKGRIPAEGSKVPTDSNDPTYQCDPLGFPRIMDRHEPIEFIHSKDRILLNTSWERRTREIWMDGRVVPSGDNLENLGPAWYGHSVGVWEGDTLVVTTVGLDDRAWMDRRGLPISFHARVEERWRRLDAETLELRMKLYDSDYYTAPWGGDHPIIFKPEDTENYVYFGWKGIYSGINEQICAPSDEVEGFNKRVRDPAATGVFK